MAYPWLLDLMLILPTACWFTNRVIVQWSSTVSQFCKVNEMFYLIKLVYIINRIILLCSLLGETSIKKLKSMCISNSMLRMVKFFGYIFIIFVLLNILMNFVEMWFQRKSSLHFICKNVSATIVTTCKPQRNASSGLFESRHCPGCHCVNWWNYSGAVSLI